MKTGIFSSELLARSGLKLLSQVPLPLAQGIGNLIGEVLYRINTSGAQQYRKNLVHLGIANNKIEETVRQGLKGYMRLFSETALLGGFSNSQVLARARIGGDREALLEDCARGSVCLALTHSGNWDLAGYFASKEVIPVLTVAEKVKPEALFQAFTRVRQQANMRIIAVEKGEKPFPKLVAATGEKNYLIPLLADRDITGRGIEVTIGKTKALVAAGPAALATKINAPLYCGHIALEKLGRARRGAAGSRWGIVINISGPIKPDRVENMTKDWASRVGEMIRESPESWFMLQKLFVPDLDPERLARARERAKQETQL